MEEHQAWMALVSVLLTLPAALDAQLQQDSGMTLYEYLVLAGLSDAPARTLQMSDLAIVTNGSLPRLSQVVTRLENKGWVRRSRHPTDARCTMVELTDAGWDTLVEAAPGHVATVRKAVFDPLTSAQVRQLRDVNRRIRDAVMPHHPLLARAERR